MLLAGAQLLLPALGALLLPAVLLLVGTHLPVVLVLVDTQLLVEQQWAEQWAPLLQRAIS